ncbi:ly6/PLAUR domain-containing protein 2-like [Sphaeramia orbicularis]|uniref:ly6/PLAUR domain-containing protein 2-like n=1 Tax=Sphaeramia orbicularis TaxID=375764 RepID=UPI00118092E7|nr:ly6/PLAUR domain-containing protein 2 [Sphaeramia orbicularis]
MKGFQFAVVLLIACISCAEALRCYRCIPRGGSRCYRTIETCSRPNSVCATVIFTYNYSYFKRCVTRYEESIYRAYPHLFHISTCSTDLCNR